MKKEKAHTASNFITYAEGICVGGRICGRKARELEEGREEARRDHLLLI